MCDSWAYVILRSLCSEEMNYRTGESAFKLFVWKIVKRQTQIAKNVQKMCDITGHHGNAIWSHPDKNDFYQKEKKCSQCSNSVVGLLRTKTRSTHDPSIPLLDLFAEEVKSVHQTANYTPMLSAFWFAIAKRYGVNLGVYQWLKVKEMIHIHNRMLFSHKSHWWNITHYSIQYFNH